MRLLILAAATLLATTTTAQAQAQATMVTVPEGSIYYVQQGDTLIGIAGESFMSLYEHNTEALEMLTNGKPSPGRIVAGMKLVIPAGIPVSSKVGKAIDVQAETRKKAETALAEAEEQRSKLTSLGVGCEKADGLLTDARSLLAGEPDFANMRHIKAYESASMAARKYEQAYSTALLAGQLEKLSMAQASIQPAPVNIDKRNPQQEASAFPLLGGVSALFIGLLSWVYIRRYKRRGKEQQRRFVQLRLAHHKKRLAVMLRP